MDATLSPITVPATSRLRYLGGMAALNLPSPTGTGDWHMEQTFFRQRDKRSRSFISGVGCPTDTTPLLGDAGVYWRAATDDAAQLFEEKQRRYLLGKRVNRRITSADGSVIIEQGSEITEEILQRIREEDKMIELTMNLRL